MMTQTFRSHWLVAVVCAAALTVSVSGEAPSVYAITGGKVVTGSGPVFNPGVIVIRNGLVEAVGSAVPIPSDAVVTDATGQVVYPGLIDMGTSVGIDVPDVSPTREPKTRLEVERWKRQTLLRPDVESARFITTDPVDLARFVNAGITSVLAVPPGGAVAGRSSLINVTTDADEAQIGNIAESSVGRMVVRTPVFLHVRFPEAPPGDAYPASLMGVVAFVRQACLDAGHLQTEKVYLEKRQTGTQPQPFDAALDTLSSALASRMPVVLDAQEAQEIRRVLSFAREFGWDPIVAGGVEADQVTGDLMSAKARVILSLNYPTRPKTLAPGADEPLRLLRRRASAPAVAAALDKAGVPFSFSSSGLADMTDFVKNAARAVKAGLPADAALRALTLHAARMAGAGDRLGSIDKGKIANILVTRGDLFDEGMTIARVFVGGRPIVLTPKVPPSS